MLDDDSRFCRLFFFCFCFVFFCSLVFVFFCTDDHLSFLPWLIFSCFVIVKHLFETKLEMPRPFIIIFSTTHPSIDIQFSPCIASLICPFCRVYLFAISSVSNVPSIHFLIPRALSFRFFFCHSGYAYTVTRTLLPPIFDIPVGFLRPAQSPS
ncbi:hypothetical protein M404DRAFT_693604 [Pisolithus tinctorius Marx 270]|uniref:Uncharacterized protein n=1 Tax=Pisolithus tinctorius Marx 270 TaxID=870435 RepID=A0A0C3PFT1_PISTI|nr:hypothetical protein M404DRAFT_693604 [Pisolithus tinctorius Marx 270]